jgi:hypothetical protein
MMYTDTLICLLHQRVYMAKLYWRIKVDGKWTWRPAKLVYDHCRVGTDRMRGDGIYRVAPLEEEQ